MNTESTVTPATPAAPVDPTALVAQGGGVLADTSGTDWMKDLTKGKEWLGRLTLTNGQSEVVVSGKIGIGRYLYEYSKDEQVDLGRDLDIMVIAGRAKALDFGVSPPVSSYSATDEHFKSVVERLKVDQKDKCGFGPEFLVWVPAAKKFMTLFLMSWSAKKIAKPLNALVGKWAHLSASMSTNADNKAYWVPTVGPLSIAGEAPDPTEFEKAFHEFKNPPAPQAKKDTSASTKQDR